MPSNEALFRFRVDFYREPSGEKLAGIVLRELNASNRPLAVRIQVLLQRLEDPRYHRAPYTKDIGDDLFEARVHNSDDACMLYFHGE